MSLPRTPARLLTETVTDTDFGGRVSIWAEVARIWIDLQPGGERAADAGDGPPVRVEIATAVARDDTRVQRGVRLAVGDDPAWTVLIVDRDQPRPGRMTLRLER